MIEQDKLYCRILQSYEDYAVVEIYLPNMEIVRRITGENFNKLKEAIEVKQDADFYMHFEGEKLEDKIVMKSVWFTPFYVEYNEKIEELYKLLSGELEL